MRSTYILLEKYFQVIKTLVESEVLTESELGQSINLLRQKLDSNLNTIQNSKTDKLTFKKTIFDTIKLIKEVQDFNNTKFDDQKTQQVLYQVYKKDLLPKFTKFWQLCAEYNKAHNFGEEEGLQSLKQLVTALNNKQDLGLKSVKTFFKY